MAIRGSILVSLGVFLAAAAAADAQVVWSDEFNGDRIDRGTWTYDVGGHGFGNGQLEYNTARPENSYIEDGSLVIEARREDYRGKSFTSARMCTQGRFAFQYGSLEARIKVPDTADGLWPAFWLLGNNFPAIEWPKSGEIDILEIGSRKGIAQGLQRRKINSAMHFADADGRHALEDAWLDAPVDLNQDYHRYKVEWTPEYLKFFLDDVAFAEWDITAPHLREFHQPFFPILNVAVGGWETSYTGVHRPEDVTAALPGKMHVDWIRLTANPHTKVYRGADHEESGAFGIYTETVPVKDALEFRDGTAPEFPYGKAAALYLWNNMAPAGTPTAASEGDACWSFDIAPGNWFGMGVFLPNFRNMRRYAAGNLHFDIQTESPAPLKVGIKSSRGGESFLPLGDEHAEFGFTRDGNWHSMKIPLSRFDGIDFPTVHQMFMIAGDPPQAAMRLSIDNVWWEPGGSNGAPPKPDAADCWPQFRGPNASGVSEHRGLPDSWSATERVAWRTAIPGRGWSSPVVAGGRVFVTTAIKEEGDLEDVRKGLYFGGNRPAPKETHRWVVCGLDLDSGQIAWAHEVHRGVPEHGHHLKNTLASETPVCDEQHVYAYIGNVGLFCFDFAGNLRWSKRWKSVPTRFGWGTAASPVLHGERIYIVNDNDAQSYLVALDKRTGEQIWRVDREEPSNWATPLIWKNEVRTELVTPGTGRIRSYDLDGRPLWECGGMSSITIPTPLAAHGLLYVTSGYVGDEKRPLFAIRPGASGDISLEGDETSNAFVAWCHPQGGPYNPSPLVYGDYLYVLYDRGLLACYDAGTGEEVYGRRRIGPGARAFTASPWAYGGQLFCLSEDGDTYVIQAGPEYRLRGKNSLGELCMATPAILHDGLIIRTESHVLRIRE